MTDKEWYGKLKFDIFKNNNTVKWIIFSVCVVLTIAWMAVIFGFSANDAKESTVQSHAVTEIIIRIFNRDFDDMTETEREELISEYDGIVRKVAHFVAYAVLGFLMYFSFRFAPFLHPENKFGTCLLSFPICALFAATDEYHQTFVDGRAGRFSDIIIDSSGALCGLLFALIVLSFTGKWIVNKQNERGE